MKKAVKITLSIIAAIFAMILALYTAYLIITANTFLDESKLYDNSKTITVFDADGSEITDTEINLKRATVNVENLHDYTLNAFIASEDRAFYNHGGINYKRILKAIYKNLKAGAFKEGASTITQQLIKNTHLNNDKTITRKLKEIKLSRELEKKYSKKQILEAYLNTIYFGHGSFGLENAAKFYFGVSAKDLNLQQSATLVGLLTSPNNNSPFKNPEKCLKRRNLVLKSMLDSGYIDKDTYAKTIILPIETVDSGDRKLYTDYLSEVYGELENIGLDPYQAQRKIKIYTYLEKDMQNAVESINFETDGAIIIRSVSGKICAYKSTCKTIKRPIGSTAKPIFVYAPAINEKKIELFTKICDEKVNFNGYSPQNYDKKYHGYVNVEEAITQSLNVPAVKTLNALTVKTAANYAKMLGIELENEDLNLSLALGAMSEGLTIKELCDCYSPFPAQGNFTQSRFIKAVTDEKGKNLYQDKTESERVFSPSTASLINKALINTAQKGTAKRLSELNFSVACKTGTCGTNEGNTDAYAISYTGDHLIGVWLGDKNNKKINVNGGNQCCEITKSLLKKMYNDKPPTKLNTTDGVKNIEIDKSEYEQNNKVILCDDLCPPINKLCVTCSTENLPKEKSTNFCHPTIQKPEYFVNNNEFCIQLCQTKYYDYIIKRKNNGEICTVYEGKWINKFCDEPPSGEYEYCIVPYYSYQNKKYFGEETWLPKVIIKNQITETVPPDIITKDWFDNSF